MNSTMKLIVSGIGALSLIIGTAFAIDARYTKHPEHVELAAKFEQYVVEEKLDKTQQRIWDTQDRLEVIESKEGREQLKQRLRELQDQKEKLEKKMKKPEEK
jgi:predicted  nucleic acid-binding Zn-ribbon protein